MVRPALAVLGLLALATPHASQRLWGAEHWALPVALINDNRTPAGRRIGSTHRLRLEVQWTAWTFNSKTARDVPMLAFAEVGRAPTIPGPVLRVPLGTRIQVSIANPLADRTLTVRGLGSHATDARDSLVIAPGQTVEHEFTADAVGTFHYWGATSDATQHARRFGHDSQLNGAFIVDAPGSAVDDRIFVMTLWSDSTNPDGSFSFAREFWAINGRAWPETERLRYSVGDSIRWRVINASGDTHPMHLHGFYFRVDAHGAQGRDTVYAPAARRMAVTERLRPGETMEMVWSPDRAGGWVFHCHMTVHLEPPPAIVGQAPADEAHDPAHHTEQGMAGLILGVDVSPRVGETPATPRARRQMRLLVNSDSTAADLRGRRFAFVLQEGATEPAPDSLPTPGSTLVLRRDEPTAITVVNRTPVPTSIHWHGLELESYYDGVVGVGGMPGMRTPPVMPSDSFTVHITPPRRGSFMYHTHMDDVMQQVGGLYAPFIVLDPGEWWDPTHDITLMAANHFTHGLVLNGLPTAPPLEMRVGERYRLRIANITVQNPNLQFQLRRDSTLLTWRPLAKDGHDLPAVQATVGPAAHFVSNGEILDVEVVPDHVGPLRFEVRAGTGRLLITQMINVRE